MGSRQLSLQLLTQYLERYGWNHYRTVDEPFEKEGLIITGWQSSLADEGYKMVIDPVVEKNCLGFKVPFLVEASREATTADRLADLLMAIGFINFRILLGKFAYDPKDGEVRFSLYIPTDGDALTYELFAHCMRATTVTVKEYAPKLRDILAGKMTAHQLIKEENSTSILEMLAQLGEGLRNLVRHPKAGDEAEEERLTDV